MNPRFSVIIPVYNGLPYISKAIDSILAQSYPAHEIIVVDDCSTDGTPAALAAYGPKITVKRLAKNGGISVARNAGIEIATGDFLAFLDADDLWFRDRLETAVGYIRRFPETGVFTSDYIVRYTHLGRGERLGPLHRHFRTLPMRGRMNFNEPLKESPFRFLIEGNFVGPVSAFTMKRELIGKTGPFEPGLRFVEDLEFVLRVAMHSNFLLIDRPLVFKRTHATNVSNDKVRTFESQKKLLIELLSTRTACRDYIERHGLGGDVRRMIAWLDYALANLYYDLGQRRRALDTYRDSLRRDAGPRNLARVGWAMLKKGLRFSSGDRLSKRSLKSPGS